MLPLNLLSSVVLLLSTQGAVAPNTSVWRVQGKPGAIVRLTGRLRSGDTLVADRMVADRDRMDGERSELTNSPYKAGTCLWANAVRPFIRLRRFARNGKLLWEWRVGREQQALQLLSGEDGDCLSPDGRRLLVTINAYQPEDPAANQLGPAVVAVDHRPRFVDAIGARTHLGFASGRDTLVIGWQRGKSATLLFKIQNRDKLDTAGYPMIVSDSADLSRKFKR